MLEATDAQLDLAEERAAAARGKLEQGTYLAPDQVLGITGEGVLVTDEETGRSAYFLVAADIVKQHPADLSYQVLTVVPDAYEWAAPSIHDTFDFEQEDVAVHTIGGSHHTFALRGPRFHPWTCVKVDLARAAADDLKWVWVWLGWSTGVFSVSTVVPVGGVSGRRLGARWCWASALGSEGVVRQ